MNRQGAIYSERLGPIRDEQFRIALARFDLGDFLRAEPITTGLFGQNVFLTSTRGQHVFRGKPHYDWQFAKERWFARHLHDHTRVSVPWPYLVDPDTELFGWSYALMPRLPGEPGWDETRPASDWKGIARAAGHALAQLQELTWPAAGEYDPATDTIKPHPAGIAGWLIEDVRRLLHSSVLAATKMTEPDVPWIEELLATAVHAFADPVHAAFVMNDFRLGNMVVERDAEGLWRVSGLFDLMECRFGDGESDLVRQAFTYVSHCGEQAKDLVGAFASAYRELRPLRPRFQERLRLHALRDRLLFWEYGHRANLTWFEPDLRLRTYVERFLPWTDVLAG